MHLIQNLQSSFSVNSTRNALCINDTFYTYKELSQCINKIRQIIKINVKLEDNLIGLITNDDIETYASLFAIWFENKGYIPINPTAPKERNIEILNSTETNYILDSSKEPIIDNNFFLLSTNEIDDSEIKHFTETKINLDNIAYILFTSGSTGKPKGIPITFKNIDALMGVLTNKEEYVLNNTDKCLQMYDLTFDASLTAFLPTFLAGACSYTVPPNSIKYFHIFKLLQKHELTVMKMVPSIINYLRPYFSEINATSVRYCIFGGAKLYEDITQEWLNCIPNSILYNHYGPTECTVCSSYYKYKRNNSNKSHNGVLSIGKILDNLNHIIVNDNNEIVKIGNEGELCLSGNQVTKGYWKNKPLNTISFLTKTVNNIEQRFYKTGDICFEDQDGDLMYIERKDFQVKIRGYRIELGEIEYHTKSFINDKNLTIIDVNSQNGNNEIVLVIEGSKFDLKDLQQHLQSTLPNYMVPTQFHFLLKFPHNSNGKLDRKKLRQLIK